jgi:pyruvate formate lyase activating enzyme
MTVTAIKGISLIDYPRKIATVLYLNHCNFRCPFCHNGHLLFSRHDNSIDLPAVLEKVKTRRDFIDGVVISGGEPTIHPGLQELVAALKELRVAVKLDTNGYRPDVLSRLIGSGNIDYIAMDIKTSRAKYSRAAGVGIDFGRISESIGLIKSSKIDYEFRTTCVPALVEAEDIEEISKLAGISSTLTLQQFSPENKIGRAHV